MLKTVIIYGIVYHHVLLLVILEGKGVGEAKKSRFLNSKRELEMIFD